MKSKVFFSVLLITCLFASCGLIRKDDPNNPTIEQYFIKHSWGSGADADWEWREMSKEGTNFVCEGLWGGIGADINKKADANGAYFYPLEEIDGSAALSIGDGVKFTYNPAAETLSATKTSSVSTGSGTAQVRFRKDKAYSNILGLDINNKIASGTFSHVAGHHFGEDKGTSQYYEIQGDKDYYPGCSYMNNGIKGWMSLSYYYEQEDYTYYFEEGKKYTYSCGDDGEYIVFALSVDGTFNAPAQSQVVVQIRIPKIDLINKDMKHLRK